MKIKIGIIGSGAMGSGIAQVAATAGHPVVLTDNREQALADSKKNLGTTLAKLVEKGKTSPEKASEILQLHHYTTSYSDLSDCQLIIEAIVEDLEVKTSVFRELEKHVSSECLLATNTSSLSVTSIAAACQHPQRVLGIHFFNPAPLMPLVEIIPALQTKNEHVLSARTIIDNMDKTTVLAKDTPGFIVNRVARPFYGEALRIYDEGIADIATIDAAMRDLKFKMGPFELMDLIGHDVNYRVTESVFAAFYYDPRYKPSLTQKKLLEAAWYGRKSGRGFYDYSENAMRPEAAHDEPLKKMIGERILAMLINEAYDALYYNIATAEDLDLAMTKGVNYPKGLIAWSKEAGVKHYIRILDDLYNNYHEDRYRCSIGLKNAVQQITF